MPLRVGDWQSESDLDSIRNSCNVIDQRYQKNSPGGLPSCKQYSCRYLSFCGHFDNCRSILVIFGRPSQQSQFCWYVGGGNEFLDWVQKFVFLNSFPPNDRIQWYFQQKQLTLSIDSNWKCAPKVNSTQDKKIWCIGRKNCCRTYACNLAKPAPISSLSWAQSRKGHGVVHIWFPHCLWLKIKQVVFTCPKKCEKKILWEMVWNGEKIGQTTFFWHPDPTPSLGQSL